MSTVGAGKYLSKIILKIRRNPLCFSGVRARHAVPLHKNVIYHIATELVLPLHFLVIIINKSTRF